MIRSTSRQNNGVHQLMEKCRNGHTVVRTMVIISASRRHAVCMRLTNKLGRLVLFKHAQLLTDFD